LIGAENTKFVKLSEDPRQQGFLVYRTTCAGHDIVALCSDIGDALPYSDLKLFVKGGSNYNEVASLPAVSTGGYKVSENAGKLSIFVVRELDPPKSTSEQPPVMTLDLLALVRLFANQ
jgi:hypothetical protein